SHPDPPPPAYSPFPYTTLFRSEAAFEQLQPGNDTRHDRALFRVECGKVGADVVPSAEQRRIEDHCAWRCGEKPGGVEVVELSVRSEEHTSELQSRENLVCRLLL